MITIPTTELLGCLTDVAGLIVDPKHSATAGVLIRWDGETLYFVTYDVNGAGEVHWTPGMGAETEIGEDAGDSEIPNWGGDDAPWECFIDYAAATDIVRVFKLPAKLWATPVTLESTVSGSRLIVRRDDEARGRRELVVTTDRTVIPKLPNVAAVAGGVISAWLADDDKPFQISYPGFRLAGFAAVRPHGALELVFGAEGEPTAVRVGARFVGFIYPATTKARSFNLLRDGSGVVTTDR